jgi:hypothetical protein
VQEIPAELATVTQLRLLRRRPAAGQTPVATLLYHGNKYTDLWQVAATEPMPDLSPGKQARYDGIRTCLRCRLRRERPWEQAPATGRRVCPECAEAEAQASWWRTRALARAAATSWAAGVVADPSVVLLCLRSLGPASLAGWVHAESSAGEVLLSAKLRHNERDFDRGGWRPDTWTAEVLSVRRIANEIRALVGRRLVSWSAHATGPHGLVWNMRSLLGEELPLAVTPGPIGWNPGAVGDELGSWYSEWLGVRRITSGSWRWERQTVHHTLPEATDPDPNPPAAVARMRELLGLMAADDHPAGPPTCRELLPGGREVCGASGPVVAAAVRTHGMCLTCQDGAR